MLLLNGIEMIQKNLRARILFGYIILMAVIGSMAAILVHERKRMQEIEAEATHVHRKPLQTFPLAGATPKSYSTNQSDGFSSSSFFARVVRAFDMAFCRSIIAFT